jgi:5-carboxymethyl-2-hydroxymuconate isomerase
MIVDHTNNAIKQVKQRMYTADVWHFAAATKQTHSASLFFSFAVFTGQQSQNLKNTGQLHQQQ